jgi:hypothetical protein
MEFARFDAGEVLRKERHGEGAKILRLLVGNPPIMKERAKIVPDAPAYAPITILVDERADGVHLSYDSMASFLAAYGVRQLSQSPGISTRRLRLCSRWPRVDRFCATPHHRSRQREGRRQAGVAVRLVTMVVMTGIGYPRGSAESGCRGRRPRGGGTAVVTENSRYPAAPLRAR